MSFCAAILWFSEAFPPQSKFVAEHIPDLSGKIIIVTGANTGIGKETDKGGDYVLLEYNAKVYIAARNQTQSEDAIHELKEKTFGIPRI
ncbi:hypothetical protein SERLA73DRAFT_60930 [Serpula lacrymans var. lacrymans S7.3]|uniref:Uncharacterized protein n=1 Tax=Serpula lacrymans var. lacrymans (strain S7.3) TaxID=936435 RepID=F8Q9M9_SERL3|nr:hypothetical protein SERLA73DRAFT_60930 [Serpula lacrymans var. lacrymans S7.3]